MHRLVVPFGTKRGQCTLLSSKGPYEEGCYTGEDVEDVKQKWEESQGLFTCPAQCLFYSKHQFLEPLAISFGLDFLRGGSRGGSLSSPSGGLSPPSSWDSCSSSE